jgi:hypothetical protein
MIEDGKSPSFVRCVLCLAFFHIMTDHASEQAIQSIIEQFGQEHGVVEDRPTDTTHATQLSALIQAWINERAAPELLYYEEELVNALRTRLEAQMNMIDDRLDHATEQNALATVLYQTEVERVKFVLKSYLRARLYKVIYYCIYIYIFVSLLTC